MAIRTTTLTLKATLVFLNLFIHVGLIAQNAHENPLKETVGHTHHISDSVINDIGTLTDLLNAARKKEQSGLKSFNCSSDNYDFETGQLTNWTSQGAVNIVSGGTDPYGGFSQVYPGGGGFSVQIGNDNGVLGGRIARSLTVPVSGQTFISFHFAMSIFNYPHSAAEASKFIVQVYDQNNVLLPCPQYSCFFSSDLGPVGVPNFTSTPNAASFYDASAQGDSPGTFGVTYSNWNDITVELSGFAGQQVTIVFESIPCVYSPDWSYAYVDVDCPINTAINQQFCETFPATVNGPGGFQSYLWMDSNSNVISNTQQVTLNTPGVYELEVLPFTSPCAAASLVSIFYAVDGNPTAIFTGPSDICSNDSGAFVVTSSNLADNFYWFLNDSLFGNGQQFSVNSFPPGSNTISLVVESNYGCTDTIPQQVIVHESPNIDLIGTDVCFGQTTNITNNIGFTSTIFNDVIDSTSLHWGDGTVLVNQNGNQHIYSNSGNYTVVSFAQSNYGCSSSDSIVVSSFALPTVSFSTNSVCLNDSSILNSSSSSGVGIQAHQWTYNDTLIGLGPNLSFVSAVPGTFTIELQVTDNNGCIDSIEQTIQIFDLPQAVISTQNVCNGTLAEFESLSSSQAGISSEIWSFNSISFAEGTVVDTILATAGNYGVELIAIDANGCSDTTQTSIEVYQSPTASYTFNPVCFGSESVLSSTSTPSPLNNQWIVGGNVVSTGSVYQSVFPSSGVTEVVLVVDDNNGCSDTITQSIVVYENPNANFISDTVCFGETSNLLSNSYSGVGIQSYTWNFSGISVGNNNSYSQVLPNYGNNTFELVVTDLNGCKDSLEKEVFVYSRPIVSFILLNKEGCSPLCVQFDENIAEPSGANYTLNWLENGVSISSLSYFEKCYENTTSLSTSNEISLSAINEFGCEATSNGTETITIHPNPVAAFDYSPNPINVLDDFISLTNQSTLNDFNEWYLGGIFNSSSFEPQIEVPDNPGVYELTLVVTTVNGCIDSVSKQISIKDAVVFYVPNTFTPDGDEYNNIFKPVITSGIDQSSYQLIIFNRWGEIVFESFDVDTGWDGTYKGELVQDGTYVWKIIFKSIENDLKEEHVGHVNILR